MQNDEGSLRPQASGGVVAWSALLNKAEQEVVRLRTQVGNQVDEYNAMVNEMWSKVHDARAERDALRAQLEATLRTGDYQIGDIVCWRGDRWFEGRIKCKTAPEDMMLDTEVWDLEVTDPGTMYADVDMTGRPVHVSEDALALVRRDKAAPSPKATSEASQEVSLDDLSGPVCGKTSKRTPGVCDGTCGDCTDTPPSAGEADTTPRVWKDLRGCEWEEIAPLDELRLIRTDPSHCREVDGPVFWRRYVEAHYGPLVEVLPNTEQEAEE